MLQAFKGRKKGAQQGHALLKKKSDALTAKFRGMLRDIVETKQSMGEEMKEASYALAKVTYISDAGSNYHAQIMQAVRRPAVSLKVVTENVAGVRLPVFQINVDQTADVIGNMGIARGHQVLQAARERFLKTLSLLVKLASIQTSFFTLDAEIKMTNRRVNALDNVVIPTLENSINYITKELDEMEREEFFRLKKIQGKKKEKQLKEAAEGRKVPDVSHIDHPQRTPDGSPPAATIFGQKDEDIIF
eukprot:Protomagalhaensia_wolfi_Nauph_80__2512@NODE_2676_length_1019_cov_195_102041_g2095_i0_p1_GENE_NODE_2676_length_1019_cov_195_102041_g2095_i0NODE_2676_length_1019_cov_195_102041_g2095_i0_p1_ORF_typecomplete_len246_score56_80ATPsynt_D/PF01813_17/2_1e71DUF1722/PF08349_11/5_8e03DUF1722/PF08349_11/3_8e02DUF1722/PF08349_11/0_73_NODE_2676_length_1019_cov_195_102041_g2095_i0110847